MNNPLVALQELGQSPWHDNIRRDLITSGALAKMIADGDITGLTSNPTIFEQAIAKTDIYDDAIRAQATSGKNAAQIFDALAIDDIRDAADLFRPVFDRTGGDDGYVSIEVAPTLAHDTDATVAEARRLWAAIDRPNLLVKIPATIAGLGAIETVIADGINVNVTLIFSLPRYRAVVNAYLAGLRRRVQAKAPVNTIFSVASFFVSRVDTAVDRLLDAQIAVGNGDAVALRALRGKAAIANAQLAYEMFERAFRSTDFSSLRDAGARPQRPLWASTSVKNPDYPDLYYVEALVGSETVDTMPPATIAAYRDHGAPSERIGENLDGARATVARLKAAGIDLDAVLAQVEAEGVASFTKSYESLLAVIEDRASAARRPSQ
ncbi:MAG: transaldolase [Gemmatimonadaceae bacterium]